MEKVCSEVAYKEFLHMNLQAQIKLLYWTFPEADTNLH